MPTASYLLGGAEVVAINQARYLKKYWFDITFLTISNSWKFTEIFQTLVEEWVTIVFLPTDKIKQSIIENKALSHKIFHELYDLLGKYLHKYLEQNLFDLVISHYSPAGNYIPSGIPSCLFLHGTPDTITKEDMEWVLSSTYKIAVSISVKEWWERLLNESTKINVIHNWVDINFFRPLPHSEKDIDIFFIWRHLKNKGIQDLLDSLSYLKKQYWLSLKTIIWWDWPYYQALKTKSNQYHLDNVSFIGVISKKQLPIYYNRSKICVFPSYKKEWVLTTLLEASACETPVITYNCCGMKDFITHKKNGILCPPRDYKKLWESIKHLIESPKYRNQIGVFARKTVVYNRSRDTSINNFIWLLNL